MSILAIDTASSVSSVAVASEGKLQAEVTVEAGRTHSETLLSHIEGALSFAGVERSALRGVTVSIGPGSFTGLRIGLATAKAIAYGLDIPLVGISTLAALALAFPVPDVHTLALMDAQKGNVYAQEFAWETGTDGLTLREQRALAILPLAEVIASLEGTAKSVLLLGDAMQKKTALALPANVRLAPIHARMPRAACVGLAALARLVRGAVDDPVTAAPLYLRRSEAEVLWEKRHGTEAAQ